jgi:hypothetical protein
MKLKVFELRYADGEKEWIADYTNIGALITYCLTTQTDLLDMDSANEIVEVPESEWSEMRIVGEEYHAEYPDDIEGQTFAEWMRENRQPGIIAGTMYL